MRYPSDAGAIAVNLLGTADVLLKEFEQLQRRVLLFVLLGKLGNSPTYLVLMLH